MQPVDTVAIRRSLQTMLENEPALTGRFYDLLFPATQRWRRSSRRRRARQERMLSEALIALVDHLDDASWLGATLPALGRKHVHYGVTDEMYDRVGECLLAVMATASGPSWTREVEAAWRAAYGAVAFMMKALAQRRVAATSAHARCAPDAPTIAAISMTEANGGVALVGLAARRRRSEARKFSLTRKR